MQYACDSGSESYQSMRSHFEQHRQQNRAYRLVRLASIACDDELAVRAMRLAIQSGSRTECAVFEQWILQMVECSNSKSMPAVSDGKSYEFPHVSVVFFGCCDVPFLQVIGRCCSAET